MSIFKNAKQVTITDENVALAIKENEEWEKFYMTKEERFVVYEPFKGPKTGQVNSIQYYKGDNDAEDESHRYGWLPMSSEELIEDDINYLFTTDEKDELLKQYSSLKAKSVVFDTTQKYVAYTPISVKTSFTAGSGYSADIIQYANPYSEEYDADEGIAWEPVNKQYMYYDKAHVFTELELWEFNEQYPGMDIEYIACPKTLVIHNFYVYKACQELLSQDLWSPRVKDNLDNELEIYKRFYDALFSYTPVQRLGIDNNECRDAIMSMINNQPISYAGDEE